MPAGARGFSAEANRSFGHPEKQNPESRWSERGVPLERGEHQQVERAGEGLLVLSSRRFAVERRKEPRPSDGQMGKVFVRPEQLCGHTVSALS
jgi:hypothetical protein